MTDTAAGQPFLNAAVKRRRGHWVAAERNERLNEAARLAETEIGGQVGEAIRNLMHVFYGTDSAQYVDDLARAVIAEHKQR